MIKGHVISRFSAKVAMEKFCQLAIDSTLNSSSKVRPYFINYERQIHAEILTSIQLSKMMSFPRFVFDVVSMLNRRNFSIA